MEGVLEYYMQTAEVTDETMTDQRRKIAALEETLTFAAQYKGIEMRACPLCKYENGVFIEACQMHKDMDKLEAEIATLRAQVDAPGVTIPPDVAETIHLELNSRIVELKAWGVSPFFDIPLAIQDINAALAWLAQAQGE